MTASVRQTVPVRLEDLPYAISVFVGSVKVAAAWGPAADGTGEWFVAKAGDTPYRVEGRDSALAVLDDIREERARREAAVWQPGDPEPGERGYVRGVPEGVLCWGCGEDLATPPDVLALASVLELTFPDDAAARRYFTCDHCLGYLDDEGDGDA